MEIRSARASERGEVLDLLARWFNNREFFARYNQQDPSFRDELCLVAVEGDRIVSTVQIFDRKINIEGQTVPLGGIGSVYTLPEYRQRGIASALIRFSLEKMEQEGFDLSLLFAERLKFYGGFGWRSVNRTFSVMLNLQSVNRAGDFTIQPFNPARDLTEVESIYDSYSGPLNCTVVRDNTYWKANLLCGGNPDETFAVCRDRSGRIAAYARCIRLYGLPMIMEYGYHPGVEEALLSTFADMAASGRFPESYWSDGDVPAVSEQPAGNQIVPATHMAHDPDLEQRLTAAGCPIIHHEDNHIMWRIISPERLAKRLNLPPTEATNRAFQIFQDPRSLYWTADRF